MPIYSQSHSYRDAVGRTAWVRYYLNAADLATAATNAAIVANRIFSITRAAEAGSKGPFTTPPVPVTYGSTSSKQFTIQDKIRWVFSTSSGSRLTMLTPSPRDRFLADGETVDLTALSIPEFISGLIAARVCLRDGALITGLIGALRVRTKSRRKAGLYLKNPQLTTTVL